MADASLALSTLTVSVDGASPVTLANFIAINEDGFTPREIYHVVRDLVESGTHVSPPGACAGWTLSLSPASQLTSFGPEWFDNTRVVVGDGRLMPLPHYFAYEEFDGASAALSVLDSIATGVGCDYVEFTENRRIVRVTIEKAYAPAP